MSLHARSQTRLINPIRVLGFGLVLGCGLTSPGFAQGAAGWTPLTHPAPAGSVVTMMLLSDGSVFAQSGDDFQHWLGLSPDAHGSYVNGTWTTLAPMSFARLYFASDVLQDGRVWVLGGEYSGPYLDPTWAPSAEIYDPLRNSWSGVAHYPNEVGGCFPIQVTTDVQLTTGSAVITGIYSTDRMLPGWTINASGVPAGATVVSVDSATQVTMSADATSTGSSAAAAFTGTPLACFGDDPSILLSGRRILAGNLLNASSYIYSIASNTWTRAADKAYASESSDEEGWTHMSGGLVLNYALFQSIATGQGYAEVYDSAHNLWKGISPADGTAGGTLPLLSSAALGFELGPALRLQDGRALVIGANQHTALYDQTTNAWSAGPDIHGVLSNAFGTIEHANFGADDAPAALMPSGHVMLAADAGPNPITHRGDAATGSAIITDLRSTAGLQPSWSVSQANGKSDVIPGGSFITSIDSQHQIHINANAKASAEHVTLVFGGVFSIPTELFDFDPQAGTVSPVSPPLSDPNLAAIPAYQTRMIVLPNGQVLFNDGASNQLYVYTSAGSANPAYLPVIQRVARGEDREYTLTGTQLNGPSDASAYGDDVQSNENFPIVRLENSAGLVFYCRSRNWTSTDVSVGQESVRFTLNRAVTPGDYQLTVSAGGLSSLPVPIHIGGGDD